jgi:hypothetical protein
MPKVLTTDRIGVGVCWSKVRVTLVALAFHAAAAGQALDDGCTDLDRKAVELMEQLARHGEATLAMVDRESGPSRCVPLNLARISFVAFEAARALADVGGAVDRQGPVRSSLEALNQLRGRGHDLEVEYADTAIRAAISAAQDERPELDLLLTHARDLAERLAARSLRAVWPRPFNVLAGELWFEVDRYEEARAAFERALKADGSPVAVVGLARAHARLNRKAEACRVLLGLPGDAVNLRATARREFDECR